MNKTLCLQLVLLLSLSTVASAQVVDVGVCDVLADPTAYSGKTIRVKSATVAAGFDEFLIKGSDCNSSEAIWLDYPSGTKGKAGPVASVRLQLAQNAVANSTGPASAPISLQRDEQFSRFDSLLATPYKSRALCLGCPRYTVSATLTGRLDAVEAPGLMRDGGGKIKSLSGFGNLNMYRARLVLQSVSDVAPREIDYSKVAAPGDSKRAKTHATPEQLSRAAAAYGAEGEDNGVIVSFGAANEVMPDEFAKGTSASPDGVLFHVTFNMDRLSQSDLPAAMAHNGTHIADIRDQAPLKDLSALEDHAWQTTFK